MDNLSRIFPSVQDFDMFLDAFDRMSVDHVSDVNEADRALDISTLRRNITYMMLLHSPRKVDDLVGLTEEHYANVRNEAEEYGSEFNEHRLSSADYGLSHRVA